MGVGRDLLEEVRLARAARPELDGVVVGHDERDHPRSRTSCWRGVNRLGLEADAAEQQVAPLLERELRSRPPTNVSSASRVDIWIGRTDSTRNGWPPVSLPSAAMYSSVTSA